MLHEMVIALVTVVALTITIISALSYKKTKNRKILIVTCTFALFFIKGVIMSLWILGGQVNWSTLFLYSSIFDLLILGLLFVAIIIRK
jgi:hypothetical protein